MYFYEVWVRSNHYHGFSGLTYSYKEQLIVGQLVVVPLRHEHVMAVIIKAVNKPKITIKEIVSILKLPPLPPKSLILMRWLSEYYPSPVGIITQQFIPPSLAKSSIDTDSELEEPITMSALPKFTNEQQAAYLKMKHHDTYLLHGRTGSGKTRLYLELAKDALAVGESVVVLTPEISLTTQLEKSFRDVFKHRVVVIHSTLTPKQRSERWIRLLSSNEPQIIIGPRSAIFAPLDNIGLIIIDEEHEPAYKQEQAPYYQTIRVASQLRIIHNAKLIMGSATPSIADYYLALTRNKTIIRLKELAQTKETKPILKLLVDCKDRSLFNRSIYLSQPLITAIEGALTAGGQSLLYLNRRGTARVIICDECDWQARCPRCDLPLTYHGDNHTLRCHVCGYVTKGPISCPKCKNPSVKYLTIGTKAVVEEVQRLFPTARIQRFDADNLKSERIETHIDLIKSGQVDIIIGTQLLAKGLDLPQLSVVGVLLADTSLQMPDFSANERTFQLLEQVVGRVGRGHREGQAIIQTYQPENKIIINALGDDWDDFYQHEIREREQFLFPPFSHMLKLTVQRASSKNAQAAAEKLISLLTSGQTIIEGPAPAFHEKHQGKYRWQVIVKAKKRSNLLAIINQLPAGWSYDLDPADLM